MMLGQKEIAKQLDKGNITIEPFNLIQLGPNSYDVRMGNWIIEESFVNHPVEIDTNNPSWSDFWNDPRYLQDNDVFIFEPGTNILTHTLELIGSYKYGTLLKARSTIARIGIDVCASAGFGDVGFVHYWTLELRNNSKNHIILKPGMRLGQIAFMEVKGASLYTGAYKQNYNWLPEDMLPKLGYDRIF